MTGEREQEVMYIEWRDINLVGSIVRVLISRTEDGPRRHTRNARFLFLPGS
jgi:hypothetical protein